MKLEDVFTSESMRKHSAGNIEFYAALSDFLTAHPDLSVTTYLKMDLERYRLYYELKNGSPDNLQEFQSVVHRLYYPMPFCLRQEFEGKTDSEIAAYLAIEIRKA